MDTIQAMTASQQSTRCDVVVNCFRKAGFTSGGAIVGSDPEPCVSNDVEDDFTLLEAEQQSDMLRADGSALADVELHV